MSAPHLSGVVVLIKKLHPDWSPAMIGIPPSPQQGHKIKSSMSPFRFHGGGGGGVSWSRDLLQRFSGKNDMVAREFAGGGDIEEVELTLGLSLGSGLVRSSSISAVEKAADAEEEEEEEEEKAQYSEDVVSSVGEGGGEGGVVEEEEEEEGSCKGEEGGSGRACGCGHRLTGRKAGLSGLHRLPGEYFLRHLGFREQASSSSSSSAPAAEERRRARWMLNTIRLRGS